MTLHFNVNGLPKPQGRPRAFAMRSGNKWQARVYDPHTTEGWKSLIALAARPHLPAAPLEGAIKLGLVFSLPRPKAHFKPDGTPKPMAPVYHALRGDFDNYAKAVCDCLTQIGMWKDDGQIAVAHIEKRYGDPPGCVVTIEEIGQSAL
jgi:Holliday junction resolvase RusA-like endonuclease